MVLQRVDTFGNTINNTVHYIVQYSRCLLHFFQNLEEVHSCFPNICSKKTPPDLGVNFHSLSLRLSSGNDTAILFDTGAARRGETIFEALIYRDQSEKIYV